MALICITIKDMPDGQVAVHMMDNPDVKEGDVMTPAQGIAVAVLGAIDRELKEPKIIGAEEKKVALFGADELPIH
ncbi:hypothetical protein AAKU67_002236 [Oxalobacteraceae bacterium GrIS 2.11]